MSPARRDVKEIKLFLLLDLGHTVTNNPEPVYLYVAVVTILPSCRHHTQYHPLPLIVLNTLTTFVRTRRPLLLIFEREIEIEEINICKE